jgi:hypothetical protein
MPSRCCERRHAVPIRLQLATYQSPRVRTHRPLKGRRIPQRRKQESESTVGDEFMRLVTWNCCRGAHSVKAPLLDSLAPDIAVIQECAKPANESDICLWFGENVRQGIVVQATNGYRLRALPAAADVPRFVFPVEVTGPPGILRPADSFVSILADNLEATVFRVFVQGDSLSVSRLPVVFG